MDLSGTQRTIDRDKNHTIRPCADFEDTVGKRGPVRPATPTIFHLVVRTLKLEAWAGRWVAVDSGGTVRCDAASLAELLGRLAREHIEGVEVMRAPDPSEPIAYGLG